MSTPAAALEPIPTFTIDLARPPRERYNEVINAFGARMRSLTGLWEDILSSFIPSPFVRSLVTRISRVSLRRVYDNEENEEVQGIAARAGVPLFLIAALNNLLDCMLGCTSGAALVRDSRRGTEQKPVRLMHFRTLDWGMDGLRDLLVVLEFVDSSLDYPTHVLARSITYAGFLTFMSGCGPGLSVSLNHRARHDCRTRTLKWHQIMVLLGRRRSVGSIIRSFMLPSRAGRRNTKIRLPKGMLSQAKALAKIPSAPCYLILCDGDEAAVIVKDCTSGTVEVSRDFIAQTNHDPDETAEVDQSREGMDLEISSEQRQEVIASSFGADGWIEESSERLDCIRGKWDRHAQKSQKSARQLKRQQGGSGEEMVDNVDGAQKDGVSITEPTLRRWISSYPTLNECSHFATILDPWTGGIRWLERGPAPE
ncbi:beta subunit of N-acylethanolamine-hydrolyzing acid amidase-domain-containing protein [Xylariaceae sp. FL0255]|nr:beta subunit of N-acylethanolamine-hydrolyzing acid amidase-domain-containing protein [Xylariaceae sp. FL0255]